MRIQHNIMAMNAYRNYNTNTSALSKNLEKLSSGYKINRAGDDAAGLAISEKMRAQITGLNAAQKNVKDGISLVKTAEGAMQEIQDMLNRMDYLATQSANGTYDDPVDRANLQKEVNALRTEIDRIADSANFNGIKLLNGDQNSTAVVKDASVSVAVTSVATGTTTGSLSSTGGKMDAASYASNFAPSNAVHGGLHPGEASANYVGASFSISLKDFVATGITNSTNAASQDTVTITIGDGSITISVNDTTGNGVTGGDIATALNNKDISIGGVTFTMAKDATDAFKIKFTTKTQADADGKAASVNEQILNGAEVKISAKAGANSGSTTVTVNDNWTHGLQDITKAVDTKAAEMGGISFKLDGTVVGDGNKLKIGDKTFVFVIGNNSKATTVAGDIEIKLDKANDYAEAARQMANSGTNITDAAKGGTFKISAIAGDTIHIDQQAPVTGTTPGYDTDALKGLFSVTTPTITDNRKATLELSVDPGEVTLAEGDMVGYNGKTYTIGAAPEGAKNADSYITAASFNAMVQNDAVSSLAAAAREVMGDGYTVTVVNGNVKIEATENRNEDLSAKADEIAAKLASVKVSKIDKDKVGTGGLNLQIGDTSDPFNQMSVKIGDMHVKAMGTMEKSAVEGGTSNPEAGKSIADIDISTQEGAAAAVDVIKNAINYVSGIRGDLGAIQNRLEHTQNNLSVMAENIQDAESTIRDTDVANEMMSYVKNNILVQSAQAMLAQANQVPQGVLQLLG